MKIKERAEYASKPKPLIGPPDQDVLSAVKAMSAKNFGSIVVVNPDHTVAGLVTERDIYRRLVAEGRDAATTKLSDIMTTSIRVASEDDELLDWLRIMSNERFRRLPITDKDGKLVAMMSQGDFVSYTWPELMTQATTLARSGLKDAYYPILIALGIGLYTIAITLIL
ncbi:CBS domain-containing protein [Pyruvatibacter sp.]|uniref:CBS domain-containing protein n=1 Tax=Pyruvatibacter sp. TaxID=1981328 RepID=UPI0032EC245C